MSVDNLTTDEIIRLTFATVKKIEATQAELQTKVIKLEDNVTVLNKQVSDLQNLVNRREQELRSLSVRLAGVPYLDDEKAATDSKFLAKRVYDKVLSPLLNAAKTKNLIDRVPQLNNTIVNCYRVGGAAALTGTGNPPPIIIKLVSSEVRLAMLRVKSSSMPAPSAREKDMGIRGFMLSEDLTPSTYNKMRELQRDERTSKVWTVDGRIRFLLQDDRRVHRAKSSFDTVDHIIHQAQR
jgi:hypothetical protein